MIKSLSTKKFVPFLIVGLFATNLLYESFFHNASGLSLETGATPLESNSIYGNNPYIGDNCTKLGEYDSNLAKTIYDFSVAEYSSRKVAYISTWDSILAYDYSDPKNPEYITEIKLDTLNQPRIAAKNNLLFADSFYYGMTIINFSDWENPQILFDGEISNTDHIYDIIIKDDILYGREYDALVMLDISDISSPKFLNKYEGSLGDKTNSFYLENDNAYLIYEEYLEIIDISDYTNPVQLGNFSSIYLNGSFTDIYVSGNIAYTVTTGGQVIAIDCSNKSNPILLDYSMDSSKYFNQIDIFESLAYVLDLETGIHVFDITNPLEITMISRNYNAGKYKTQLLMSNYFFLFDSHEGIEVYSILDQQNPEFVSILYLAGYGNDVAISDRTVLVANGYNGLEIYHINTNNKPELRSRILSSIYCEFVQIRGKLAYVYNLVLGGDLYIIDFSNLKAPILVHTENIQMEINDLIWAPSSIQVYGDFLIASYRTGHYLYSESLRVYNLNNESNFELIDVIEFDYFTHFFYLNSILYLTDGLNLMIYSYEPEKASLISQTTLDLSPDITAFYVTDDYAFFSNWYDTYIFDITNPLLPLEIFRFSEKFPQINTQCLDIVISADIIYVLETYFYTLGDSIYTLEDSSIYDTVEDGKNNLYFINFKDRNSPYLEGIFSCNDSITSFVVSKNKVYLSALEVNLEIVQLNRFITRQVIIIVAPIVGVVVISGIAVLVLILWRKEIRRATEEAKAVEIEEELETLLLQDPEDIDIDVNREDFDSKKIFEYAKEVFDDKKD